MGAPRITFLSATFDEETNLSTVAVKYLNKVFYGYSKPHPEDLEHLSKVRGGRIAEIKAQKKAYEYVKEETQKKYNKSHNKGLLKDLEGYDRVIDYLKKELKDIRNYDFKKFTKEEKEEIEDNELEMSPFYPQ